MVLYDYLNLVTEGQLESSHPGHLNKAVTPILPNLLKKYPGLLVAAFLGKMLPGRAQGNFSDTLITESVSLDEDITLGDWILTKIVTFSTPDALNGIISNILPAVKETIRMAIKMVCCTLILTNSMDLVQSSLT
jgi:hypothetical protein